MWLAVGALACALDYYAEPLLHFPLLAVVPVLLASWYSGWIAGLTLAIALPLVRLYFALAVFPQDPADGAIRNALVRIAILGLLAVLADRSAREARRLAKRVNEVEGLLPICGFCKKIRDNDGEWQPLEVFVSRRTDAVFSHGLCPVCARLEYGDLGAGLEHDEEPGDIATVPKPISPPGP